MGVNLVGVDLVGGHHISISPASSWYSVVWFILQESRRDPGAAGETGPVPHLSGGLS